MKTARPWVKDAAAGLGLLALALIVGAPGLRAAYHADDWADQNLPHRAFVAAGLASGELRWWCGELGAGFPLHASGLPGAAYPPNLLYLGLEPPRAAGWLYVLGMAWAGLGVYALLRTFGASRPAAWSGAVVYPLAGAVAFRAIHANHFDGLCWLGWWLLALERGARGLRWGYGAAGVVLGLILLAGHGHPALMAVTLGPVYLLARLIALHRPAARDVAATLLALSGLGFLLLALRAAPAAGWLLLPGLGFGVWHLGRQTAVPGRRELLRGALGCGLAVGVGALIGAVQWLPAAELAAHSVRAGPLPPAARLGPALEPRGLLEMLAPNYRGSPFEGGMGHRQQLGIALHWEASPHLGLLPLLLLVVAPPAGRRPERWLFWGLAVAALALAVARSPLYAWLSALPGWSGVRGPGRLLALFALGAAATVGLTIDDLLDRPPEGRRRLTVLALTLLFVLLAAGLAVGQFGRSPAWTRTLVVAVAAGALVAARWTRLPPRRWAAAVAGLVAIDLVWGGAGYHPVTDPAVYAPNVDVLRAEVAGGRIWVDQYAGAPLQADRSLFYPGIENVGLYSPLALPRWAAVRGRVLAGLPDDLTARRWLALWRVRLIAPGHLRAMPGELVELAQRPFPEAWATPRWQSTASDAAALELVFHPAWRPEAETVFSRPHAAPPDRGELPEVLWTESGRHRLTVRVRAPQPAAVVVSRSWCPGWRVLREGAWSDAEPANVALMGVEVPAGYHRLDFVYRPMSVRLGLFGSLAAVGLLSAGLVAGSRR